MIEGQWPMLIDFSALEGGQVAAATNSNRKLRVLWLEARAGRKTKKDPSYAQCNWSFHYPINQTLRVNSDFDIDFRCQQGLVSKTFLGCIH